MRRLICRCTVPLPPFQRQKRKRSRRLGPKDQALRDWRGMDLRPIEKAHKDQAVSACSVVKNVLNTLKLDRRRAETEVIKVWNQMIDPAVTEHAQPAGIRKGTLFVSVDSSVWLDEIVRYRRHEILKRMQLAMSRDMIQKISFRIG